jgi:hypothetical protein
MVVRMAYCRLSGGYPRRSTAALPIFSLWARTTSWPASAEKFGRSAKGFELRFLLGRQKRKELGIGGFMSRFDLIVQRADLVVNRLGGRAELRVDRLRGNFLTVGQTEVIRERVRCIRTPGRERRRRPTAGTALRESACCDQETYDNGDDFFHLDLLCDAQYRAGARKRLHEAARTS